MAPDLPEKLLGIDIGAADDRQTRDPTETAEDEELVRFVSFGVGEHRLAVPVDSVKTITDVPSDLTRVPRTPEAIEGMTDLRGEITAVLDITAHFPTSETRNGREQLLVFDTPADEQSAAARVDDVFSVDAVPERNVLGPDDVESREYSSDSLEHPLVDKLVEQERERRGDRVGSSASTAVGTDAAGAENAMPADAEKTMPAVDADNAVSPPPSASGDRPPLEEIQTNDGADANRSRQLVLEVTPLVDVEKLLLASGHLISETAPEHRDE
ncbi:chemotaxis protein CheW [Natrarchaeobius chitinivorans]|uniref:Chemotaxis protein CheW n=1 Tax=Natrarchaeobius chitinivorans TaxID=1679083 RepID=A0A3N6LUX5_NATCH|nr:chemotaxis protein CheW [Natrarchaeobius chitinivorans]RQG92517.1 chemotaxis protein CheW [Natrarchaeobius chitinivorans]